MNDNGTDVIRVSFEGGDLLRSIVVVDTDLEIIGTAHNPVLAGNEAACSYGDIGELEGFDNCLAASKLLSGQETHAAVLVSRTTICRRDLYGSKYQFCRLRIPVGFLITILTTIQRCQYLAVSVNQFWTSRQVAYPWLSGVKVNALDSLGSGEELSL